MGARDSEAQKGGSRERPFNYDKYDLGIFRGTLITTQEDLFFFHLFISTNELVDDNWLTRSSLTYLNATALFFSFDRRINLINDRSRNTLLLLSRGKISNSSAESEKNQFYLELRGVWVWISKNANSTHCAALFHSSCIRKCVRAGVFLRRLPRVCIYMYICVV